MSTKPVLYQFLHSVWSQAPLLGLVELGYPDDAIELKTVNLMAGENFAPEFLKINPKATLPTLVVGDQIFTDTTAVVEYLVKNAPKPFTSKPKGDFISVIHEEKIDPNHAFLAARGPDELKAKQGGPPAQFVNNRQDALLKFQESSPSHLEGFYKEKVGFNGFLAAVYAPDAAEGHTSAWFAKSNELFTTLYDFILTKLPTYIPNGAFISGESGPGEDDLHLAAWLGRILLLHGGDPSATGINTLEPALGGKPIPTELKTYWKNWSERESWKKAYAEGLH